MISFDKCADLLSISEMKAAYFQRLVAPMDGMWDSGFTDPAPHWEIRLDGASAGYYAANDEGALLQFYVRPSFEQDARTLFDHVIAQDALTQIVVSTIDPSVLSLCLDLQKEVTVHTYLYELAAAVPAMHRDADGLDFRLVEKDELDRTIAFQQASLGGEHDLTAWLQGYSANLIERKELFVLCRNEDWIGLGERRVSDSQAGIADVGMMVIPSHRKNGWATYILRLLVVMTEEEGRRAICSATVENIASQKAIERAGFVSRHRIMNVAL